MLNSPWEDFGKGESESEESKSEELQSVFVMKNAALHYIPLVGNYQRTKAVKRAAH